ncbi:MAG TPA: trypsin-like peptidase domain-containing protein [Terriglobales bacterium]|nr:trypsin-like peptidase domain-containing protein [Terriglobales bacterium]
MAIAVQAQWDTLSGQFAEVAEQASKFVVAVHGGGGRIAVSGILWRSGIVVTASYVLRRIGEYEVVLWDKSSKKASLAGRDPGTDLAVLRVEGSTSTTSQFANADEIRVGQVVLAIGRSTLGDLSASAGIIARLGDSWQTWRGGRVDRLLRPDVTLYRGQSGSALVDSRARVLGMNTSALARSAAITVPNTTVDRVVNEILQHGGVFRPYLGLAMQPIAIPPELKTRFNLQSETALMVMQVEASSPSADAGITLGDVVVGIAGAPVQGIEEIQRALSITKRGDSVDVEYVRGGQLASVKVKLSDRPRN